METILFCVCLVAAFCLAGRGPQKLSLDVLNGVFIGLAVWTRPDGLTLLPFCAWLVWERRQWRRLAALLGGAGVVIALYFVFNLALSSQLWPNTFLAKQTEYAPLQALPLWQRLAEIFAAPLVGVLLLLLPGIALQAKVRWVLLLWAAAFLTSYALRLPVTYQHGRYLIPVIPILIIVGVEGLASWVRPNTPELRRRVVSRTWVLGTGAVAAAFWGLGLNALIADVKVVNSEMAATAEWVAVHIPPGTLVAAHDIGALGYFADVRLVDLAGLVSPQVIPLMGDEAQLWKFVRESGADYLITYPGWCPSFVTDPSLTAVFQTGPLCTPDAPNLHMTVYALQ